MKINIDSKWLEMMKWCYLDKKYMFNYSNKQCFESIRFCYHDTNLGPILLIWIDFKSSMDK